MDFHLRLDRCKVLGEGWWEVIDALLFYLGVALTVIGGVLDIIAAIGFFKFKDFYTRLHAATIGAIGEDSTLS